MVNASEGGRLTRALHRERYRIVLVIAGIEGLVVWATHGLHLLTIVVLGLIAFGSLMLYGYLRERTRSPFLHQIAWIIAASQLGATIVVGAGAIVVAALVVCVIVFSLVALGLLLLERR